MLGTTYGRHAFIPHFDRMLETSFGDSSMDWAVYPCQSQNFDDKDIDFRLLVPLDPKDFFLL